jgi:hypothetical protein
MFVFAVRFCACGNAKTTSTLQRLDVARVRLEARRATLEGMASLLGPAAAAGRV